MPPARDKAVKVLTTMKHDLPVDREFNTPAEMLSRAMFIGMLAALTSGVLLSLAGLLASEPRLLFAGVGCLAMTCIAKAWLQRSGAMREVEPALAAVVIDTASFDEEHGRQLLVLLEE